MRPSVVATLVLAMALCVPGSSRTAKAKSDNKVRIATLAPRDSDLVRGFAKVNNGLKKATNNEWSIQLYPGGMAGDEKDFIRKMRVNQLDGAAVTAVGLSQIARELTVLNAPGAIESYDGLERVQKTFNKEWEASLDKDGLKVLGWAEIGLLRYFSKAPVTRPSDFKHMRPWVWPESHATKAMWAAIGCTGVPLGVPEVYGGLQTGMIDAVISTSLAVVALQWHVNLKSVTNRTHGPLVGGLVLNKPKWDSIPPDVRAAIQEQITTNYEGDNKQVRKDDETAFKKLLQRGFTARNYTKEGEKEYQEVAKKAREAMVGRVYSRELLDRVMQVARGGNS